MLLISVLMASALQILNYALGIAHLAQFTNLTCAHSVANVLVTGASVLMQELRNLIQQSNASNYSDYQ